MENFPSYAPGSQISHPLLAEWQRTLEERHTIGFIDHTLPVEEQANGIFGALKDVFYEMRVGEASPDVVGERLAVFHRQPNPLTPLHLWLRPQSDVL